MVRSSLILSAAKRVPSIRFRSGANAGSAPAAGSQAASAPQATRISDAIEDYLLPARYQRKPIPQYEIDYINRGGPE